jgi:hypothetical protein
LADGILFERAGVPAASICTDSFVTMPHPLASLDHQQLQERARDLLPDILRILGAGS